MAMYWDPFRELDRLAAGMLDSRQGPRVMPIDLHRDGFQAVAAFREGFTAEVADTPRLLHEAFRLRQAVTARGAPGARGRGGPWSGTPSGAPG